MGPFDYSPYRPSWRRSPVWSRIKPWLTDGIAVLATLVTIALLAWSLVR